ncbi:MAG TPA: HD domain-containing phosphohydrolase [Solirubrobacteraceae bacterium]|nr:HD domain-containing phosphohydrolase [Solirubrobacteraceae bacterium]
MILLDEHLRDLRILAVDDQEVNLLFLRRTLEAAGCRRVISERDPARVPAAFVRTEPDLVVLDLHMPGMDGFELMRRLAPIAGGRSGVPFLVLTGDEEEEVRQRALGAGARDFLTKPFSPTELILRVRNLLEVQQLHRRLRAQNLGLEQLVAQRTRELEQARMEVLGRLALAAEYRDDATQEHAWRIGRICRRLAHEAGLDDAQADLIERAAPLHDIGKVGIRDAVLLKPAKLSPPEFDEIKAHTTIGAEILSGSSSSLLRLAEQIALSHHERWDGSGYPNGLRKHEIPLAGRIVAVADVFDALTHERPYKRAWPVGDAVREVLAERGRGFDPEIVDAFAALDHVALRGPTDRERPGARTPLRAAGAT